MTKKIYLDYAATTPIDPEVLKIMKPYFGCPPAGGFGNPSSLHFFGQEAMAAVDESREKIAKAIDAPPAGGFREIIFTGSATEANNLALRGAIKAFRSCLKKCPAGRAGMVRAKRESEAEGQAASRSLGGTTASFENNFEKPQIIVSAIEHESILETCRDLENEGVEIIYLPVNRYGFVNLKKLKESLNERTILVSIMHANNEIGTIQPITEISNIIKNFRQTLNLKPYTPYPIFHTDAVQAFQFLNCDVNKLGVDLMTLSAHKIYGPKGIGLLYVKNQLINPIITGGGQEFGLRSGTENVPAIVGFGKAVELAVKNREKETKKIAELTNYFWKEIKKIKPKAKLNGIMNNELEIRNKQKLPNILNIYFSNPVRNNISNGASQNSQDLLMKLDLNGIAVSSGSACSTRSTQPSHVLKAISLSEKRIKSSLRFSFGKFTTKEKINNAIKIIKKI